MLKVSTSEEDYNEHPTKVWASQVVSLLTEVVVPVLVVVPHQVWGVGGVGGGEGVLAPGVTVGLSV